MTDRLSKLILLFAVAVVGLATTLTIHDFQYEQTARSLAAAAAYSILTPLPPLPPAPPTELAPSYTFSLKPGWNQVSVASPVALADINNCALGWPAYEFIDGVYTPASTLETGHGYWVWADEACEATLPVTN